MKKSVKEIWNNNPMGALVAGALVAAILLAVLGHMLYIAGIILAAIALVVGFAYFVGARHGNKPRNDKTGDPGSGHKP